jgi:sigma-B regulation protein RsbU (phosphoserine phosphatase)
VWKRPSTILAQLNRSLHDTVPETATGLFASALICRLTPSRSHLVYASAGAEPPILFNSRAPYWRILTTTGLLLGVEPDTSYADCRIPIEHDDVFIAFTDGITESIRTGLQDRVGRGGIVQALRSSLSHYPPKASEIFRRLDLLNDGLYRDDATLLVAAIHHA